MKMTADIYMNKEDIYFMAGGVFYKLDTYLKYRNRPTIENFYIFGNNGDEIVQVKAADTCIATRENYPEYFL